MKTSLKSILAALSVAILVALTGTSCVSSGGMHNMATGSKDNLPHPMANSAMHGHR